MVKSNIIIMVVTMVVGLIFTGLPCLEAQSSPVRAPTMSPMAMTPTPMAKAPTPDCITSLSNVSDCLTYVQIGSKLTTPEKPCCPELAGLLESNPICLCGLVGSAADYGIDVNRATMLPKACKLSTPPLSACPASPMSSPMSAPTPSATSDALGSTAGGPGSDGGVGLGPSASGNSGSNGVSSTAVHDLSTLICLVAAIFIAYYF